MDIWSLVAALFSLAFLIGWHELGHFVAARLCGVQVLRFSIGFGKALLSWHDRQGTQYTLSAIPFGGYVRMLGEDSLSADSEQKSQRMFSSKAVWQRLCIVLAGPFANLLLAFLLFIGINSTETTTVKPRIGSIAQSSAAQQADMQPGEVISSVDGTKVVTWSDISLLLVERIGESGTIRITTTDESNMRRQYTLAIQNWLSDKIEPDPVSSLGITPFRPVILPIIATTQPQSAADKAGLQPGDRIVLVNNKPMENWSQLVSVVRASPSTLLYVQILRDGETRELTLIPEQKNIDGNTIGFAGISPLVPAYPEQLLIRSKLSFVQAVGKAFTDSYNLARLVVVSMYKLLIGDIALGNISGPIGIVKVASESANSGLWSFLLFVAYLSISLCILNLLPLPVLDGGQALFLCIEGLIGKQVPLYIQNVAMRVGVVLLVTLMIVATVHDIFKL